MKYYGQSIKTGGFSIDEIDKIIHQRYFLNQNTGFFIEAGANDGLFLSSCKCFEDIGWKGINIEPCKSLYDKLVVNRPNSINLQIGIFNEQTEIYFDDIDFDNGGFSRISDQNRHQQIDKQFNLQVKEKYKIKTDTYENILRQHNVKSVDLFVLDVEGFEIEVIDGMGSDVSIYPNIFCIEHTHVGLDSLVNRLKDIYVCDWKDGLNVIFRKIV